MIRVFPSVGVRWYSVFLVQRILDDHASVAGPIGELLAGSSGQTLSWGAHGLAEMEGRGLLLRASEGLLILVVRLHWLGRKMMRDVKMLLLLHVLRRL